MGTKALSNGGLSNGTHGGVPIKQNGGPSEVHNGLNGAPNSHISEGKEPFLLKTHVIRLEADNCFLTNI